MSSNRGAELAESPHRSNGMETHDFVRSTAGVYVARGMEQVLITDLLISRILGKIKIFLRCL